MSEVETPASENVRDPAAQPARIGGFTAIVAGALAAVAVTIQYTQEYVDWSVAWVGLTVEVLSIVGFVAGGVLAIRGALRVAPWLALPALLLSALLFLAGLNAQVIEDLGVWRVSMTLHGLSGIVGLISLVLLLIAFARRPRPVRPVTPPVTPDA